VKRLRGFGGVTSPPCASQNIHVDQFIKISIRLVLKRFHDAIAAAQNHPAILPCTTSRPQVSAPAKTEPTRADFDPTTSPFWPQRSPARPT